VKKLVAIDVVLRGRISRIHGCRNAVELKVVLLSKVTGGVGDGMMPQLPVHLFGKLKCFSVSGSVQFGKLSSVLSKQRAKKSDEKRSVSTYPT
jgi:hypothetical protein